MIKAPLTHDHGTPPPFVTLMQEVFGGPPQTQPMHASYITLLSHEPKHIRTFAALGRELGDVVNVHGY